MTPTCAICRNPLRAGQFLIMGTEVIHKACVGRGMTEVQRLRQSEADACTQARRCATASADLMSAVGRATDALRRSEDQIGRLARDLDAARRDRLAAIQARNDAVAERDEARAEQARIRATTAVTTTPEPIPERDATELRFSLMDLD